MYIAHVKIFPLDLGTIQKTLLAGCRLFYFHLQIHVISCHIMRFHAMQYNAMLCHAHSVLLVCLSMRSYIPQYGVHVSVYSVSHPLEWKRPLKKTEVDSHQIHLHNVFSDYKAQLYYEKRLCTMHRTTNDTPWCHAQPNYVMPQHVTSYHITSVMSIISCHIMLCHVMSHLITSLHVIYCHFITFHGMLCHAMSYDVLCHVMLCHIMSYNFMSCHIMPCHAM